MQAPVLHRLRHQKLWLSAQRCIFWEEQQVLIASDLHFGKTGHFRKSGIAVPQLVYKEDLQRLVSQLQYFKPKQLIVIGDFFHSSANVELQWFEKWRADFAHLQILLVKGNHDVLKEKWYAENNILVLPEVLVAEPFIFTHDRCNDAGALFNFCGHLHPGIVLQGLGRQQLRLPCFYFTEHHCVLPAFSLFTGTSVIDPQPADKIYAVANNQLVALQ